MSLKLRVQNLVNDAPILRSISCLVLTASASLLSGGVKVSMARQMSVSVTAEKWALNISMSFFTPQTTSTTSKAIASPSLSQSSHRISRSASLATYLRFLATIFEFSVISYSSSMLNKVWQSVDCHYLHESGNLQFIK